MEPQAHNATGAVDPQAICGGNSLVADNQYTNCRIVTTYGNGMSTSCSAVKIGDKLLGTAGETASGHGVVFCQSWFVRV